MEIKLSNGSLTVIDDCDADLSSVSWNLNNSGYVTGYYQGRARSLHTIIAERIGLDCSQTIDHKDRDRLNNQRNNLRSASHSQWNKESE